MTQLNAILDAQGQQLSLDDLLAVIAEEERDSCEVEAACRQAMGLKTLRCGFIGAGTVYGCPRRKKYMMEVTTNDNPNRNRYRL